MLVLALCLVVCFVLVCFVLSRVSMSRLTSYDCVLTVSLSGIAKCLFCAKTLSFIVESRPLGSSTRCLLTKPFVLVAMVVVL